MQDELLHLVNEGVTSAAVSNEQLLQQRSQQLQEQQFKEEAPPFELKV